MSGEISLDRQVKGKNFEFGNAGADGQALVIIHGGTSTPDTVVSIIKGSETVEGDVNVLGTLRLGGVEIGSVHIHTQSTPASQWTINHNLGFRPTVEFFTSGGVLFNPVVIHPNVNQAIAYVTPAIAGTARCT